MSCAPRLSETLRKRTISAQDLYRRMVFNLLAANVDDHLRNHGFPWVDRRSVAGTGLAKLCLCMSGGSMEVVEGEARFGEWSTWYRVSGNLVGGLNPLVVAHGGPGCTHDYVDSFKDLASGLRAVVHYDQIGNGRSTHLPDEGGGFWTIDFFLRELDNLLEHLGIRGRYDLLGQSWGGMTQPSMPR